MRVRVQEVVGLLHGFWLDDSFRVHIEMIAVWNTTISGFIFAWLKQATGSLLPVDRSIIGWCVSNDQPLISDDMEHDPRNFIVDTLPAALARALGAEAARPHRVTHRRLTRD